MLNLSQKGISAMEYENKFYTGGFWKNITVGLPENGQTAPLPAVVLSHGHSRHRSDGLDALAATLNRAGYVTARFDFRGCGADARRYTLNCASEWPADLANAISYVSALPFVDRARVGLAGISMGAATSVYVAGMDRRVRSVVAMGGIADCYAWIEAMWKNADADFEGFLARIERDRELLALTGRSSIVSAVEMYMASEQEKRDLEQESFLTGVNAYVSLASIRDMMDYRPIDHCPAITCPIFFAHGGADNVVPIAQSERMFSAVASEVKQFKVYEGIEHNIPQDPNRDVVFTDIVAWFDRTL